MGSMENKIRMNSVVGNLGNIDSCEPLDQGLESRNFLLSIGSDKYVLKSYKDTSIDEISFEVSVLNHLKRLLTTSPYQLQTFSTSTIFLALYIRF